MPSKHIIIIGGGIAGCSSANAMAKLGWAVTLIERSPYLAQGASGNQHGVIYPRLTGSKNYLNDLAIASYLHSLQLIKSLNLVPENYQSCGVLQLSFNAREHIRHNAVAAKMQNIQLLSQSEASAVAGIPLKYGGLYLADAGWINPRSLCEKLTQHVNIKIICEQEAIQLHNQKNQWIVNNSMMQTVATAPHVIIANAYDARTFSQTQHLALTAVRGQITLLPANNISASLKTVVCADNYLCPAQNNTHCLGASYTANDFGKDIRVSDQLENLSRLTKISDIFTKISTQTLLQGRVSWRCQTPDYLPVVGQVINKSFLVQSPPRYNANPATLPWIKGLYVSLGYGSKGLMTSPYCAELLAKIINQTHQESDLIALSPLNPNRFTLRQMGLKQLACLISPLY